jgi:hypothetical protein
MQKVKLGGKDWISFVLDASPAYQFMVVTLLQIPHNATCEVKIKHV